MFQTLVMILVQIVLWLWNAVMFVFKFIFKTIKFLLKGGFE